MADPIGTFTSKMSGLTLTKTADGHMQQLVNYEGNATGFGPFVGTLAVMHPLEEAGATSGTCTWVAKAILQDKSIIGDIAEGTWERLGEALRSKIVLRSTLSDGSHLRLEGVADWDTRTFDVQIYEAT